MSGGKTENSELSQGESGLFTQKGGRTLESECSNRDTYGTCALGWGGKCWDVRQLERAPWNTLFIPRRGREGSLGSGEKTRNVKQAILGSLEYPRHSQLIRENSV